MKNGDIYKTNKCGDLIVVEYRNARSVDVEFINTGYKTTVLACAIRRGTVNDKLYAHAFERGYMGEGSYNGNDRKLYKLWYSILQKCYDEKYKWYHRYGGRGITVCEEWYNYQVFSKWAVSQENSFREGFEFGLLPDAEEYSPSTFKVIPSRLNKILVGNERAKESNLPRGVCEWNNYYKVSVVGVAGKTVSKYFKTPEEAGKYYKEYKEKVVKTIAEEQYGLGNIDEDTYKSFIRWEVE